MFLSNFKKRFYSRDLLNRLRAYSTLINNGQGETQIWNDITDLVMHSNLPLSVRQKLLQKSVDSELAPALMLAITNNKFPVIVRGPAEWRNFLKSKGCNIHWISQFLWSLDILRKFRAAVTTYHSLLSSYDTAPSNYAVLFGLHDNAMAIKPESKLSNFLTWFKSHFKFDAYWVHASQQERSTDNILYRQHLFPSLDNNEKKVFFKKSSILFFNALKHLIVGNWHETYMLPDAIEYAYVESLSENKVAKLYSFTVTHYIYRPLWTYAAEGKGAKICLFFYSTNNFDIHLEGRDPNGKVPGFMIMNWPIIYTQSGEHKTFLEGVMVTKAKIFAETLIPYEDNGADVELSGKFKVVYLDVQPFRPSFMASIGRPCHFYTEENSLRSLNDIAETVKEAGATLYIKPKRWVGRRLSKSYRNAIEAMEAKGLLNLIDYGVSPARLFEKADLVICQPFTSASLYARAAGKPVVYYDALSIFKKLQPAAQGIQLLQEQQELQHWLKSVMNESQAAA